jgi:hypothetical protein
VVPEDTGRPSYHPATLLKVYLYGYLNRIPSSRRLERETQRNIELMWLTGRLMPDFKTIADFRRDNGPAIRAVCSQFVPQLRTYRRHPDEFLPLIDAVGHLLDKPLEPASRRRRSLFYSARSTIVVSSWEQTNGKKESCGAAEVI